MQTPNVTIFILLLSFIFSMVHAANLEKRAAGREGNVILQKRPFCNAFTGCGGKRSDPDAPGDAETDMLLDQLSHQILALVRLLEALHARIESAKVQSVSERESRAFNIFANRHKRSTVSSKLDKKAVSRLHK